MSRHRKIKALDLEEEYDDYYGDFDDDDDQDFDDGAFEAKYLSSGIDLNVGGSNNISSKVVNKLSIDSDPINDTNICDSKPLSNQVQTTKTTRQTDQEAQIDSITADLTKIAIQHLDKYQWQLPLLEMDKKFRDRTYYKHYTDFYISSLRSKLGHFMADNQMISNPMRHHVQQELDNYGKYSRMFELLNDYYKSLGVAYFSFATPSPDEEIVIGCRLGTKVKKAGPKQNQIECDKTKTARFEFSGKSARGGAKSTNSGPSAIRATGTNDLTITEDFTSQQMEKLAQDYNESLKVSASKSSKEAKVAPGRVQKSAKTRSAASVEPKQLQTLVEKRKILKDNLKKLAEPSDEDKEAFKRQALKNAKEYSDMLAGSKARINLIVVGHVDAGKSTLVGHLLFKLGQISGKQMHRFEVDSQRSGKASFKFAWAMDETAEERDRGVTIDIALTQFETENRDIVLIDAPGHVDFVPAVISGAAQADAALLIVDATRGEFETGFLSGGQTREHTLLVRSLGVKSIVVVVNKMDNVNWSPDRFNDIVQQLKPFLKQVGFNLADEVQFVACSGLTGDNLIKRREIRKTPEQMSHPQLQADSAKVWDSMPSLVEAIDRIMQPQRPVDKPTRLCVTDIFKGMTSGVSLGCRVVGGKVEAKQKLCILPPNENCEIKQVELNGSKASKAFAGDIVTVIATGVEMNKLHRGCILSDTLIPCRVTNRFQARVVIFQNANTILLRGSTIEVHINGIFECGQVRRLISLLNKNSGEVIQKKPRCITKNSSAMIQFKLERVVCCELYQDNKDLGRFMLRSSGKTIGAGLITKIKSAKLEKRGSKMKTK